jgi:hypothetical protein
MTQSSSKKPIIPETILWRKDDGKAVIFDEESGEPYLLNETGTRIWELCQRGIKIERIISMLTAEFDADPATIKKETYAMLTTLQDKNLLRLTLDGN